MTTNVAALYVRKDSVYKNLVAESFDIDRDATLYNGPYPIIAHPPCGQWGKLSHFAYPNPIEKQLALIAINQIRVFGGVLEHPRASKLWPQFLPLPGSFDSFGGFTISIDQFWFGHKAKKTTFLYFVGCKPSQLPQIPLRFDLIEHGVSQGKNKHKPQLREISKADRERTPLNLALWLIEVAQIINDNSQSKILHT